MADVSIKIDESTLKHLNNQFELAKKGGEASAYRAFVKMLFKIKSDAQLRLTGKGHIITSRLKNSIYVQGEKIIERPDNHTTYTDKDGKSFSSTLNVKLKNLEFAVGTNVHYAKYVEKNDSFLYWALKNVNVMDSVAKDMQNDLKYGKFLNVNKG